MANHPSDRERSQESLGTLDRDTIAAIATASGEAGVGVIRISGPKVETISQALCGKALTPRYAHFCEFHDPESARLLDSGIALFFQGPASFTGEDILELQGHGGPVVLDGLMRAILALGARPARPGEFSERAYLNGKIDLLQAEAIADLISSRTDQAARGALKNLQGEFSQHIDALGHAITAIRVYVEAALDFPEEEIDFLADKVLRQRLDNLKLQFAELIRNSDKGRVINDGLSIALAGKPNAGKSSLLNLLSGQDSAIVTEQAGTTRDVLREQVNIDGLAVQFIDTAGLRSASDHIEQEGIRRANAEFERADIVLLVVDARELTGSTIDSLWPSEHADTSVLQRVILVINKVDLIPDIDPRLIPEAPLGSVTISALTHHGIDELRGHILKATGLHSSDSGQISARRRHLDVLHRANDFVVRGYEQLQVYGAGELLAEDLASAHRCLADLTGAMSSDELLGEIFSNFCIGK